MIHTTLCYIEKDGCYLMLHRIKKKEDLNRGKWVGIGGKLEAGETKEECLLREVKEETSLTLSEYRYCGEVHFIHNIYPPEIMHLYHATDYEGEISDCNEGVLAWQPISKLDSLPMWEGDKIFFSLLRKNIPPFKLILEYQDDELVSNRLEELKA